MNPYKEQLDAVAAALEFGRGTIVMPTGMGKSVTIALLINELKVNTLIVVPTLELKRQLTSSLMTYFGQNVIKDRYIVIENIDSSALQRSASYDCVIIDEAHHAAAETYRKLNKSYWNGIYYRFFFTATPFRSRDEEQILLEALCGQVIYEVPYQLAVDKGYIVPLEAYYLEIPKTAIDPDANWPEVYSKLVVNNEVRNKAISELINILHYVQVSALTLVKEIKHGNLLSGLSRAAFANGESDDCAFLIKAFSEKKLLTLLGTTGVCGEGVDTRAAEYVIIAGLGKAKTQFMQSVGRAFRTYPDKTSAKVILIKDKSHKFTLRHFNAQVKILRDEYGVVPIKLEI